MANRRPSFRVLVWDSGEDLLAAVGSSLADAEVLLLRNCSEPERVARAVADFLPEVVICGRLAFQSLGLDDHGATPMEACENGPDAVPIRRAHDAARPKRGLNPRDRELLLFVYRGLTNKEIAQHFGIPTRTVKGCLSRLFAVFDVSNRTELVGTVVDLGLVETAPGPAPEKPAAS